MKLKYNFIVRNVAGQAVALAVGEDNRHFNGMIKLNSVGEHIFKLLEKDVTLDEIVKDLTDKYEVTEEEARTSTEEYLAVLLKNGLIIE